MARNDEVCSGKRRKKEKESKRLKAELAGGCRINLCRERAGEGAGEDRIFSNEVSGSVINGIRLPG